MEAAALSDPFSTACPVNPERECPRLITIAEFYRDETNAEELARRGMDASTDFRLGLQQASVVRDLANAVLCNIPGSRECGVTIAEQLAVNGFKTRPYKR